MEGHRHQLELQRGDQGIRDQQVYNHWHHPVHQMCGAATAGVLSCSDSLRRFGCSKMSWMLWIIFLQLQKLAKSWWILWTTVLTLFFQVYKVIHLWNRDGLNHHQNHRAAVGDDNCTNFLHWFAWKVKSMYVKTSQCKAHQKIYSNVLPVNILTSLTYSLIMICLEICLTVRMAVNFDPWWWVPPPSLIGQYGVPFPTNLAISYCMVDIPKQFGI